METFLHASGFSELDIGIPQRRVCILPDLMPKRLSLGKYLEEVRIRQLDLTLKEAKQRADQYRSELGANTIRDIELEKTLNPGILTVEAIALAYGLPSLDVISHGLSEPPEPPLPYEESRANAFLKEYLKLPAKEKDLIESVVKRINATQRK